MKSLSEIDTTSKRASRAMGFSWGESEEIGKSIRLLELFCNVNSLIPNVNPLLFTYFNGIMIIPC